MQNMSILENFLFSVPTALILLYIAMLLSDLRRPFFKLVLIASIATIVNNTLEHFFGPFSPVKMIAFLITLILLYSYVEKVNLLISAFAIIAGGNIIYFFDSTVTTIFYNILNILPRHFLTNAWFSATGAIIMWGMGLGVIIALKSSNWKLYSLSQLADYKSREHNTILFTLILLISIPIIFYCFVAFLMGFTLSMSIDHILIMLNTANALFMLFFFILFYLKKTEKALEKILKGQLNSSTLTFIQHFLETKSNEKINENLYVKVFSSIKNPQLRAFYQMQFALAMEREIDFITCFTDCSGLDAYMDDAFIRMMKALYENAFESVESAELKEIYNEISKDDDGGTTIIIKNNGDILPTGRHSKLFEPGFTTKDGVDRGYGLYRVKKLIDYYQGHIDIRGSDGYTQITISLPFKELHSPAKKPLLQVISRHDLTT